jgi:exosome complex RNA-binding protein Csl4
MSSNPIKWELRKFQFIFKKNFKFFSSLIKLKDKKISIKKKKNICIHFILQTLQKYLIIGCIASVETNHAVVIVLYSGIGHFDTKKFYLSKNDIYGKSFSCINIRNCVTVGDIVIGKIDKINQRILSICKANLGVLLSIGTYGHFLIPINNYEMICFKSNSKEFRKVSKMILW